MPSMELDDDDILDQMPMVGTAAKPNFPYSLRIALTDKELEKMGCDPADFKPGDLVHLTECFARVTDAHHHSGEMGATCRVELQIEHCNIESETAEDEED